METVLYPTASGIDLVLRWSDIGPVALDPPGAPGDNPRTASLLLLRRMVTRLEMPRKYEQMRKDVFGKDIGRIDDRLRMQMLIRLRLHGYVYRTGETWERSGKPEHAAVPLTGRKLHIVRMLARGLSGEEMQEEILTTSKTRVWENLYLARKTLGVGNNRELVAAMYRREYLPTDRETEALSAMVDGAVGHGWVVGAMQGRGRVLA